ncbi:MAG: caspase family protein, partial [Pyrinomonadaceae bacterium]
YYGVVFSPDRHWLASGGNDHTLRIWDIERGDEVKNFSDGDSIIEAIAFSPDGKMAASGGTGNSIIVRDLATGREVKRLDGHTGSVSTIAFSPDGRSVASGSEDQTVKIWDIVTGKAVRTLKGHTGRITAVRYSDDGAAVFTGSEDKTVRGWQTANGRKSFVLNGHTGTILAISPVPMGRLMSADADRNIKLWDISAAGVLVSTVRSSVDAAEGEAESTIVSLDRSMVATGNGAGTVTISDAATGSIVETLENHTVGYYGVVFSPDRHWLASAGYDNTVKIWDLTTGRSLSPLTGHTGRVTSVVYHTDNKRVISGSIDHHIRIWDTNLGRSVQVLKGHTNTVSSLSLGAAGRLLASGSSDRTVGVWDVGGNKPPRFLMGHTGEVISVSVSPNEDRIASGSMDGTIKIWDAVSGVVSRTIEPGSGEVDSVCFSPNGKFLASGGIDKMVRIWDADSGKLLQTIAGHTGKINSIAFNADGTRIVSSGQDKTMRTWDVAAGRETNTMAGHAGAVFQASYSSDGRFLSSASEDGSIILWKADTGDRLATLISLKNSDDWMVVTPDGFFDGSPSSWDQLSWRFERSTFNVRPVEVFFNEFYSPGLLSDVLNGGKMPANSNIAAKDRRQPRLKLSLSEVQPAGGSSRRNVNVDITVAQAPAGAEDVRLFRNGSLVRVWRGDVLKGQETVTLQTILPIIAGDNRLTAYAFNRDDIKSSDATLTVNRADLNQQNGVGYFLAIGINEYANAEFNLKYAVADAQDFSTEMRSRQSQLKNYSRVEVVSLNDTNATKANILKALSELATKVQPEDALVIYYAGHGTAYENRFYLIPHDLGYDGGRTQLDKAGLQSILSRSISDQELEAAVEGIDAGRLLFVIDACNSGQALESDEKRLGPMNSKGLAQLAYEKGMYILTAAQSYQAAQEAVRLGHGFLTYALVEEGLKTNAADREPKDGQVLLREWLDYAALRVPQIQEDDLRSRELEREKVKGPGKVDPMNVQRPRVFYRRETERYPLVVAKY